MLIDSAGRQALVEAAKARGVRRVVYFHTDHFEPWKPMPGRPAISQPNVEDLVNFADRVQRIDFARRLSLFYKAHVTQTTDLNQKGVLQADNRDIFGFANKTSVQHDLACHGMGHLARSTNHEIQVHIHHENFTSNDSHKNPVMAAFFADPEHAARDGERLALAIRLWLEAIRAETGLELERWFFVHGLWALNASDPKVCKIHNEIEILMQHGCLGDFTFPAGRKIVDPQLEEPFFIRPVHAPKCYDLPEAHPESALGNGGPGKFFIWNSKIKHQGSSVDYYAPWLRKKLEDVEQFGLEVIERSHMTDGTLWFKTHGHSLHQSYSEDSRIPIYPHEYPGIQAWIGSVLDACSAAGAEVQFWSASEVFDAFASGDIEAIAAKVASEATALASAPPTSAQSTLHPGGEQANEERRNRASDADLQNRQGISSNAELVNTCVVSVLKTQIAALGEAGSGAGAYYHSRAERGVALAQYEVALAQYLVENKFADTIVEIGSGAGAFPLLLALDGFNSLGIEADRRRHKLSENALSLLAKTHPDVAQRCRLMHARFPQVLDQIDVSKATAITTNIITSLSPEEVDLFIERLSKFRNVISDVSRFIVDRSSVEEQDKLIAQFAKFGLVDPKFILDSSIEGRYCLFVSSRGA